MAFERGTWIVVESHPGAPKALQGRKGLVRGVALAPALRTEGAGPDAPSSTYVVMFPNLAHPHQVDERWARAVPLAEVDAQLLEWAQHPRLPVGHSVRVGPSATPLSAPETAPSAPAGPATVGLPPQSAYPQTAQREAPSLPAGASRCPLAVEAVAASPPALRRPGL